MNFKNAKIVLTLSCSLIAGNAIAQNAGGSGRALDAKINQGGAGAGTNNGLNQFNHGNNIVTGNVGGLSYFHGDVGYVAPGAFQGTLGSTDLFRFTAQSIPTNNYNTLNQINSQRSAVFNSMQSSNLNQIQMPSATHLEINNAIRYAVYNPQSSTLLNAPISTPTSSTLQFILDKSGAVKETVASPLGGLRTISPYNNFKWLSNDLEVTNRIKNIFEHDDKKDVTDDVRSKNTLGLSHGKNFGIELTKFIQGNDSTESQKKIKTKIDKIEFDLFAPSLNSEKVKPGDDVYVDVLSKFKKQLDDIKSGGNKSLEDIQISQNDETLHTPPSKEAIEKVVDIRQKILNELLGADNQIENFTDPLENKFNAIPEPMKNLIKAIDLTDIKLSTFSGKSKSNYINQWLKKAETLIAEEDYFRAQKVYHSILTVKPGHPLARVGIIHAQLGSGMVRSAVFNLRKLFVDHPELLKARYTGNVIPTKERMKEIRVKLEKIVKYAKSNDAAIALAYIAFQGNSPKLTKFALDIAQSQNPNDTLVLLLRKLWIKEASAIKAVPKVKANALPTPETKPELKINLQIKPLLKPQHSKKIEVKTKKHTKKITPKLIKKKQQSNLELLGGSLDD